MVYAGVTAEEYEKTFRKAKALLAICAEASTLDLHELAHQATEIFFQDKSLPLKSVVENLLVDLKSSNEVQQREEEQEFVGEAEAVEISVDLRRLYLLVYPSLSEEDKWLYQKIGLTETLTEDEYHLLEDLGVKVKRILDAKRSPQKFFYKTGAKGRSQAFAWQALKKRSAATGVKSSGDRRSRERFRH